MVYILLLLYSVYEIEAIWRFGAIQKKYYGLKDFSWPRFLKIHLQNDQSLDIYYNFSKQEVKRKCSTFYIHKVPVYFFSKCWYSIFMKNIGLHCICFILYYWGNICDNVFIPVYLWYKNIKGMLLLLNLHQHWYKYI